jgi:type II secretory pathway component PulF
MASAIPRGTLGLTMRTLRDMYARQADHGLGALQAILPPVLLIGMAIVMGYTIVGLFLPLIRLISAVTG